MNESPAREAELIAALRLPAAYPDATSRVEVVETHISWVFLTATRAYKLKKPVRFDFLDFSTIERRAAACREEVRLNRRLAPDVYRGVVPVVRSGDGQFRIDGPGEAVDWVVVMRRLDATTSLDRLLIEQRWTTEHVAALADRLAGFYATAARATISASAYPQELLAHVRGNRAELLAPRHALPPWLVRRVHAAQLTMLDRRRDWFEQRVWDGRVVDGHGDLRPEHVYFDPAPEIIDCIEFNAEYRRIDVLDELCFLAEECDALGAGEFGAAVLSAVCDRLSAPARPEMAEYYKAYRACVRAKVATLRSDQEAGPGRTADLLAATRYLESAEGYLPPRPFVVIVCGAMGAGKSTLATALAERWGAELFRTDVVRRELFGDEPRSDQFSAGRYAPAARQTVYVEIAHRAETALAEMVPVILDGAYLTNAERESVREAAQRRRVGVLFLECRCPAAVASARIATRLAAGRDASEARPELLVQQAARREPFLPLDRVTEIDTMAPLDDQIARAVASWREI